MSKRKFNREESLEENEVIIDEFQETPEAVVQDNQAFTSSEQATFNEQDELAFAKQLTGTPQHFDQVSVELIAACVAKGLAADFGGDGVARGFKWKELVKRT